MHLELRVKLRRGNAADIYAGQLAIITSYSHILPFLYTTVMYIYV